MSVQMYVHFDIASYSQFHSGVEFRSAKIMCLYD